MARGSQIMLSRPTGGNQRLEGVISGTPSPGTWVTIQTSPLQQNPTLGNSFVWEPYLTSAGATADPRLIAILDADWEQGMLATTPYVTGQRCFIWVPYPGDFMNVLVKGQAGTGSANAFTIGERLVGEAGSGKFIQESTSSIIAQFMCLEHIDEVPNTDTLVFCQRQ